MLPYVGSTQVADALTSIGASAAKTAASGGTKDDIENITGLYLNEISKILNIEDGEKKEITILWLGYLIFIFSITGKPCSYSPKEAAWNQIVLSFEVIFFCKMVKTSFLPSTKSLIFGLKIAKSFTTCDAKTRIKLYRKSI
jgi:hypothetical protein